MLFGQIDGLERDAFAVGSLKARRAGAAARHRLLQDRDHMGVPRPSRFCRETDQSRRVGSTNGTATERA
ncbi:MAG: hypothetical protein NVS2B17_16420 [Candidatus Velthaea sp.]